jgi:twin arginine-targeting protein translocase, TatA/E family
MLGVEELIPIFAIIVLLFGADKLPELARSLGSSKGEFKKAQRESELNLRQFKKSIKEPQLHKAKYRKPLKSLELT